MFFACHERTKAQHFRYASVSDCFRAFKGTQHGHLLLQWLGRRDLELWVSIFPIYTYIYIYHIKWGAKEQLLRVFQPTDSYSVLWFFLPKITSPTVPGSLLVSLLLLAGAALQICKVKSLVILSTNQYFIEWYWGLDGHTVQFLWFSLYIYVYIYIYVYVYIYI